MSSERTSLGPSALRGEVAWLALILLAALGLRAGRWAEERASPLGRAPVVDERTYDQWAQRLAGGAEPEVPYMAPLQAWSLAAWHRLLPPGPARDAQRGLQLLLGLGTVAATWALGRRLAGPRAGLVAAGAVALYVPLVYHELTLLRDGPATCVVALGTLLVVRLIERPSPAVALLAGLTWGVGALWRENLLVVALPGLAALLTWALRDRARRAARAAAVGCVAVGLFLPLLPVLHRNARLEGGWSLLPTWNGGCVFYLANRRDNPGAGYLRPPFVPAGNPEAEQLGFRGEAERLTGRPLQPHEISAYWLGRGVREVLLDPGLYARKVLQRAVWSVASGELVHARDLALDARSSLVLRFPGPGFGVLVGFGALGAALLRRRPAARAIALVLLLGFLTTVTVAFATRYRLPAVPLLAALAAAGARGAVARLRAGRPVLLAVGLAIGLACTWIPVPYDRGLEANSRLNRARVWMELGEPGRAFAELDQLEDAEARGSAFGQLGLELLDNDEAELAADASRRAVSLVPGWGPRLASGWEARARRCALAGDESAAEAARAMARELATARRPG